MSSDSKDYGSEYYTATNYSYRVPNRAVNDKLTYLISYKTGKWFRVIPSHLLNELITEIIEEAYLKKESPLGI